MVSTTLVTTMVKSAGYKPPVFTRPDHTQWHKNTHTHTHTLSRVPLDEESALCSGLYLTTNNIHKRETFMTAFQPATLSSERRKTYALDRAATCIGNTVFQAFIFLGAVAKLLKALISFFMYVCPTIGQSVRMDKFGSHSKNFHENCYLKIFPKSVENIKISLKSDKNKGYFTRRPIHIFYHISQNAS